VALIDPTSPNSLRSGLWVKTMRQATRLTLGIEVCPTSQSRSSFRISFLSLQFLKFITCLKHHWDHEFGFLSLRHPTWGTIYSLGFLRNVVYSFSKTPLSTREGLGVHMTKQLGNNLGTNQSRIRQVCTDFGIARKPTKDETNVVLQKQVNESDSAAPKLAKRSAE